MSRWARRGSCRSIARCLATLTLLLAFTLLAPEARAQRLVGGGFFEAETGLAGGGPQAKLLRRARTTLRFGADVHIDERPGDAFAIAALLELEPRAAFGLEAFYLRQCSANLVVGAGVSTILSPDTLLGISGLATYEIPLGKVFRFTFGPALTVYFAGSDLPSQEPIWQLMFRGGFRVAF